MTFVVVDDDDDDNEAGRWRAATILILMRSSRSDCEGSAGGRGQGVDLRRGSVSCKGRRCLARMRIGPRDDWTPFDVCGGSSPAFYVRPRRGRHRVCVDRLGRPASCGRAILPVLIVVHGLPVLANGPARWATTPGDLGHEVLG